jgi:hypothetical protein
VRFRCSIGVRRKSSPFEDEDEARRIASIIAKLRII